MDAETTVEPALASTWAEDFFFVAVFAVVGVLGIGGGIAADSQVQMSIGLILVGCAAKVLVDLVRQRQRSSI